MLACVAQEHKDLQKEVRKLRESEPEKDLRGQQTKEQSEKPQHNASEPGAGPLTPERPDTARTTDKVCVNPRMKTAVRSHRFAISCDGDWDYRMNMSMKEN